MRAPQLAIDGLGLEVVAADPAHDGRPRPSARARAARPRRPGSPARVPRVAHRAPRRARRPRSGSTAECCVRRRRQARRCTTSAGGSSSIRRASPPGGPAASGAATTVPTARRSSPTTSRCADGILRSDAGQAVALSPALWGVDPAIDTVTEGPFLVAARSGEDPALGGRRPLRPVALRARGDPVSGRRPTMPAMNTPEPQSGVDRDRVRALKQAEDARFAAAHPRSAALLERGRAVMPNGVPMAWMRRLLPPPPDVDRGGPRRPHHGRRRPHVRRLQHRRPVDVLRVRAGAARPGRERAASPRGNQFLLPTEDSIVVSEELGRRFGLPKWQYTSSATHANTEAIRVARVVTGRDKVLMFDGKYHGHLDEALVELDDDGRLVPEERGVPADTVDGTVLVPFNDVAALERALERRDVAIVLTEPAITNNIGLLLPEDGFHAALRRLTRETGTLLAYDETHTQVVGPGGLVRQWGLEPDLVIVGKSIAGGLPFGAWGMTDEIAAVLEQRKGPDGERFDLVATGGTIFGNALAMAAARAVMTEILTPEAYAHTQRLGARLAGGMRAAVEAHGLPWHIHHLGPRSGLHVPADADPERRRGPRGRPTSCSRASSGSGSRTAACGRRSWVPGRCARSRRRTRTSTRTSRRGTRCWTRWPRKARAAARHRIAAMTTLRRTLDDAARRAIAERTEALFRRSGALRDGHFVLKSGRHSRRVPREVPGAPGPRRDERAVLVLGGLARAQGRDGGRATSSPGPTTGGVILAFETGRQLGDPGDLRRGGRASDGRPAPRVPARLRDPAGRAGPARRRHPHDRRLAARDDPGRRGAGRRDRRVPRARRSLAAGCRR